MINTGTTIVIFLMVFLIQNTQNRDGAAIQAKLGDLILTSDAANEFIGIEKLTDRELAELRAKCEARAEAHHAVHQRVEKEVERRAKSPAKRAGAAQASGRRKPDHPNARTRKAA